MNNWKIHSNGDRMRIRYYGNKNRMKEIEEKLNELGIRYSKYVRIEFDIIANKDIARIVKEFPNVNSLRQNYAIRWIKSHHLGAIEEV